MYLKVYFVSSLTAGAEPAVIFFGRKDGKRKNCCHSEQDKGFFCGSVASIMGLAYQKEKRKMKRVVIMLAVVMMLFCTLISCGKKPSSDAPDGSHEAGGETTRDSELGFEKEDTNARTHTTSGMIYS